MPARVGALLDDPNPVVRESAVKIAGYFGYAGVRRARASRAARDASEVVRRTAVEHLPFFEDPAALPALLHALEFDTAPVRAAAAAALARVESADTRRAPRCKRSTTRMPGSATSPCARSAAIRNPGQSRPPPGG